MDLWLAPNQLQNSNQWIQTKHGNRRGLQELNAAHRLSLATVECCHDHTISFWKKVTEIFWKYMDMSSLSTANMYSTYSVFSWKIKLLVFDIMDGNNSQSWRHCRLVQRWVMLHKWNQIVKASISISTGPKVYDDEDGQIIIIIIRSQRRQRSVASTQSRCVHDGNPWSTRHEC